MRTATLGVVGLCALTITTASGEPQGRSPEDVVRQFCKMEFDGTLLQPGGARQADHLLVEPISTGRPDRSQIHVIKDYIVRRDRVQGKDAEVSVRYFEYGQLDESLRFTKNEGKIPNQPTRAEESFLLRRVNGWKIDEPDGNFWLGPAAAISYLSTARDATKNPAIKSYADASIRTLRRLVAGQPAQPDVAVARTPTAVVQDYCAKVGAGLQLTDAGWRTIAALFAHPSERRKGPIAVVDGCFVGDASIGPDDKADVLAESIHLLQFDPDSARVVDNSMPPGGGAPIRWSIKLSLDRSAAGVAWKIDDQVPPPGVTVATAIRYITDLRARTTDPHIRENATRTLALLQRSHHP
jgi:hypothetical protein